MSCDSAPVQLAWVNNTFGEQASQSPLVLSDFWPHGTVCRSYGVFNEERGMAIRSLFVIDTDGTILHSEESTQRGVLPDIEGALDLVAGLELNREHLTELQIRSKIG